MKTAVILFNLGGPLGKETIKPFLFNFFMDKNIIAAPLPVRYLLAKWISWSRGRGAADGSYRHLNYVSPLLENTKAQGQALQEKLGDGFKVFIAMRYWHPRIEDVMKDVAQYGPDKIVLLPLYPQYSTTTTNSSFEEFEKKTGIRDAIRICCYPFEDGFIKASVKQIQNALAKAPAGTRVLFSAHGLPQKTVDAGDPYQWQCEETARKIAEAAGLQDWQICYQSRVGPLKWIGPSTEEALEKAAKDKVGVIVYPHAFVSEHVETLVELDIEYREKADHIGLPYYAKVDTVGTHPDFIEGLARLVHSGLNGTACGRICPATFKKCPCRA